MDGKQDHACEYAINVNPQTPRIVMTTLYSVAALVTTVLNSLILISIWKTPSLHKPSYILIASLALSDLLVGAVGEPLLVVENIAVLRGWPLNDVCTVLICTRGVNYALAAISLLTLSFISLDRLLAVKLRNRYQSVVTQKRVLLVLVTLWIVAWCFPAALLENLTLNLNFQNLTALFLFVGIVVSIPVITIIVCYSVAFYSLRKITSSSVSPSIQNTEAVARPRSNIDVAKYRKSLITMIAVSICTILFYSPFACIFTTSAVIPYSLFQVSKKSLQILHRSVYVGEFIFLLNSAVNPLLYLWRIRDIREAVKTTALKIFQLP